MLTFAMGVLIGVMLGAILACWLQHVDREELLRQHNRSVDAKPERDWPELRQHDEWRRM